LEAAVNGRKEGAGGPISGATDWSERIFIAMKARRMGQALREGKPVGFSKYPRPRKHVDR
jgi:hypothetical protein